jgi:uncharacterized phage-associated protein
MLLNFDIEKTIAAVAYLVQREGGELDVFLAIKALYVADKDALIQWGKTITGDSFVSMDKGPVLSTTYNLFKGEGPESEQAVWNANISGRVNHKVHLLHDVPLDALSEREIEALESARLQIQSMPPWRVARWLHDNCPEWQDPRGSSMPIDPSVILREAGISEEEIQGIEESNQAIQFAKYLLGSR